MDNSLTLFFFVLATVTFTWAFPNGGPYYSCKSLLPGHNQEPRSTSPPYKLSVSRTSVPLGGTTSVTLEGLNSTPFMGFMCAASVFDDETNHTFGAFSLTTATSDLAQLLKCSGSSPNTGITHLNKDFKELIGFDWTVPEDARIGFTYKIRCSFVQSFEIFWINSLVKITVVDGNENATLGGSNSAIATNDSGSHSSVTTESSNIITGSKQANIESTGTGINETTQNSTDSSSSNQFNATDNGNVSDSVNQDSQSQGQSTEATFNLFRALELNNGVMSGMSTPLDLNDKTTTADTVTLISTSSSRNTNSDIVRSTDSLRLSSTDPPLARPNSSSNSFSANPSSQVTPLTTRTVTPNPFVRGTVDTNNIPDRSSRPTNLDLVPDFIKQNPNALFLKSWNIRNTGSVRRSRS